MKTRYLLYGTLAVITLLFSSANALAQTASKKSASTGKNGEPHLIQLNQIPGKFTNGDLTLAPGTYKFEVTNTGVGHEVGLVLAPKKVHITQADHITNAYVTSTVKDGETKPTKGEVVLKKGEYVYFCPLNPTGQYTISVK